MSAAPPNYEVDWAAAHRLREEGRTEAASDVVTALWKKVPADRGTTLAILNFLKECGAQHRALPIARDALQRWPNGMDAETIGLIDKELALVARLEYEKYFLTVYDIVAFARSKGILCQGRGSAANSIICYCLFITELDPVRMGLLIERFDFSQKFSRICRRLLAMYESETRSPVCS